MPGRPTAEQTKQKSEFAADLYRENPDAGDQEIQEKVAGKFGQKLSAAVLLKIRRQVRQAAKTQHINGKAAETKPEVRVAARPAARSATVQVAKQVLHALDALLNEMRSARVENINLHASGQAAVRMLEAKDAAINLGGRRNGDGPRRVQANGDGNDLNS